MVVLVVGGVGDGGVECELDFFATGIYQGNACHGNSRGGMGIWKIWEIITGCTPDSTYSKYSTSSTIP